MKTKFMKSTTTVVYKVTTGKRKSITSSWTCSPYEQSLFDALVITYPTLKWITPRIEGAHILAFKSLEDAKAFVHIEIACKSLSCNYEDGLIIWKCLSDSTIEYKKGKNDLPNLTTLEYYKERLKDRKENWNSFPTGTIYCNRIRLIKKLETHYYVTPTT